MDSTVHINQQQKKTETKTKRSNCDIILTVGCSWWWRLFSRRRVSYYEKWWVSCEKSGVFEKFKNLFVERITKKNHENQQILKNCCFRGFPESLNGKNKSDNTQRNRKLKIQKSGASLRDTQTFCSVSKGNPWKRISSRNKISQNDAIIKTTLQKPIHSRTSDSTSLEEDETVTLHSRSIPFCSIFFVFLFRSNNLPSISSNLLLPHKLFLKPFKTQKTTQKCVRRIPCLKSFDTLFFENMDT